MVLRMESKVGKCTKTCWTFWQTELFCELFMHIFFLNLRKIFKSQVHWKLPFSFPWFKFVSLSENETIKNYLSVKMCVYSLTAHLLPFTLRVKEMKYSLKECERNQWSSSQWKNKKKTKEIYQLLVIAVKWWWMVDFSPLSCLNNAQGFIKFFQLSLLSLKNEAVLKAFSDYW